MKTIRLLKDYGDFKAGDVVDAESEEDAQKLIDAGVAEIYAPKAGDSTDDIVNLAIAKIEKEEKKEKPEHKEFAKAINTDDEMHKKGGFVNMAEFAQSIYGAAKNHALGNKLSQYLNMVKATGMSEGVAADGGFLVPTEFRNELLMTALEASVIRGKCTTIPMATNAVRIPMVNDTSHASNVYGGVTIYRAGEGGTKTGSKPAIGQVELTLHKLIGLVYATDELLEDSPISLEPILRTMFANAIAFWMDEDIINGTGAGMALGVVNAPCTVSVAKEAGQAAAGIATENIVKMWSRCHPASQGRSVWLANSDTFPSLSTLSLNVGTGGSAVGLLQVNGVGIAGAPNMSLLGKPLFLTEHCQTLGTSGDIILGDFSQYLVGEKTGGSLKVDTSIHVQFVTDETAFRFVMRYDGQPWWGSALTPKHGTNTLSPFVKLDARP